LGRTEKLSYFVVTHQQQTFIFCCDAPTTKYDYSTNMSSPKRPARAIDRPAPKLRKCGSCGQLGHDRRTCSVVLPEVAVDGARILQQGNNGENVVEIPDPPPPPVQAPVVQASLMDWEKIIYVVFDLETRGRSRQQDEVIELAAVVLAWTGVEIEEAFFSKLVKPLRQIPPHITTLTSISKRHG
jgi:hypothetical protein